MPNEPLYTGMIVKEWKMSPLRPVDDYEVGMDSAKEERMSIQIP
jgi:hypothetical protein